MKPILQIALDFVDLPRALKLAEEAVAGGADWLEAGTPLIKSCGLEAIRQIHKKFPKHTLVADMKTMDVGRIEVEIAAKAGAKIVAILGVANDSTICECIEAGKNYGAKIMVDLLEVEDALNRAKEIEKMGADYLGLHTSIDEQMQGKISFEKIKQIKKVVNLPIAVAGGINSENAVEAVKAGAEIIIVGGAITKSADARKATAEIKKAITEKIKIKTELYQRVSTEEEVQKIFTQVSTANISDALHRGETLKDIFPIVQGLKMVGKVVTVRTYPGDWAKPVEAVDQAKEGDVIVIDAGGVGPAVWGELASHSAKGKKIAGVVINGAIRDVVEIRKIGFPAFAKIITPQAGEPKGLGEIGIPITISGIKIFSGDWVIGDDDGVIVVPQNKAVEIANRAMDVLEKENRLRKEIDEGGTLGYITEVLKWEKQ